MPKEFPPVGEPATPAEAAGAHGETVTEVEQVPSDAKAAVDSARLGEVTCREKPAECPDTRTYWVQRRLCEQGYLTSRIDCLFNPATREALRRYELHAGHPADGLIDREILQDLRVPRTFRARPTRP